MQADLRVALTRKVNEVASAATDLSFFGLRLLRLPFLFLLAVCIAGCVLTAAYVTSTAIAVLLGYALPTTAILKWSGWVRTVAQYDYNGAQVILTAASLCAVANALSFISGRDITQRDDDRLVHFISRWGLPLFAAAFVLVISANWAGLVRPADFNGESIGGLVPFSDATAYAGSAFDELKDGVWGPAALRRPLAEGFRSVLLIAGGASYPDMLLIQAMLAATATWVAVRSIARWSGAAAGFAFAAMAYAIQRSFLTTTLTEPLGLIWALFSIPFFVTALSKNSIAAAYLAFGLITIAIMSRMGAMFIIPAVAIWMVLCFGDNPREKATILATTVAIFIAVLSLNKAASRLYGTGADLTGSNFAYVACGLSIGDNWSACEKKYAAELRTISQNEKAHTDYLYAAALANIRNDPMILVRRLATGGKEFLKALPASATQGYLRAPLLKWLHPDIFIAIATTGLVIVIFRNWKTKETLFWTLVFLGIVSSSTFVYFDDGLRVMSTSYPMIAMMLACGLRRPWLGTAAPPPSESRLLWAGGLIAAAIVVAFLVVPSGAYKIMNSESKAIGSASGPEEHIVFGGRRMSGFLIVADGEILPTNVPSLHLSDFEAIVQNSNIEIYQGLVTPQAPATPFAYIYAPRAEPGLSSSHSYLVPPEVIIRKDVTAWRLKTEEWQRKPGMGSYWFLVRKAVPIELP